MTRDEALARLREDLGFVSTSFNSMLLSRLDSTQRDLELGKTLPEFLVVENTLTIPAGVTGDLFAAINYPAGFLRLKDENSVYFLSTDSRVPNFIKVVPTFGMALEAIDDPSGTLGPPARMVLRKSGVNIFPAPDGTYSAIWSYYQADTKPSALANGSDTNLWLTNAEDWILGETGVRQCRATGNASRLPLFQDLALKGRAAVFGEIIADELQGGPIFLGADN